MTKDRRRFRNPFLCLFFSLGPDCVVSSFCFSLGDPQAPPRPLSCRCESWTKRGTRYAGVGFHKAAKAGMEPKPRLQAAQRTGPGAQGPLPLTFLLHPFPEPGAAGGGGTLHSPPGPPHQPLFAQASPPASPLHPTLASSGPESRKFTLPGSPEGALLQGHGFWGLLLGGLGSRKGCVRVRVRTGRG